MVTIYRKIDNEAVEVCRVADDGMRLSRALMGKDEVAKTIVDYILTK